MIDVLVYAINEVAGCLFAIFLLVLFSVYMFH